MFIHELIGQPELWELEDLSKIHDLPIEEIKDAYVRSRVEITFEVKR